VTALDLNEERHDPSVTSFMDRVPWVTVLPWVVSAVLAFAGLTGRMAILEDRDQRPGTAGRLQMLEYRSEQNERRIIALEQGQQQILDRLASIAAKTAGIDDIAAELKDLRRDITGRVR